MTSSSWPCSLATPDQPASAVAWWRALLARPEVRAALSPRLLAYYLGKYRAEQRQTGAA